MLDIGVIVVLLAAMAYAAYDIFMTWSSYFSDPEKAEKEIGELLGTIGIRRNGSDREKRRN